MAVFIPIKLIIPHLHTLSHECQQDIMTLHPEAIYPFLIVDFIFINPLFITGKIGFLSAY
jgi:hypothetical protein